MADKLQTSMQRNRPSEARLPDSLRLARRHQLVQDLPAMCHNLARVYRRLKQGDELSPREVKRGARFAVQVMDAAIRAGSLDIAREIESLFFSDKYCDARSLKVKGHGLAIARSNANKNAWVHAITLALDPKEYVDLSQLSRAVAEMRATSGPDPLVFAALIHRANLLVTALARDNEPQQVQHDLDDLTAMINYVRDSERFRGDEVIETAALEGELRRIETSKLSALELNSNEFARLERSVSRLVGGQDGAFDDGAFYSRQSATVPREAIRQAHVLHLSLRFLLLRARLAQSLPERGQRQAAVSHSLAAAHALHDALLALVQLNARSSFVHQLRERQVASLFRLLWVHLYSPTSEMSMHDVRSAIRLLEDTLSVVVLIPTTNTARPDPRRTNVGSAIFKRLLLSLVEHLDRDRHRPDEVDRATSSATLSDVRRLLDVMRAFRVQDARSVPVFPTEHDDLKPAPVFWRRSILWHTVRAVLTAPADQSQKHREVAAATPGDRLDYLLDIVDEMREAGDKVRKDAVRDIVERVVESDFQGDVWKAWRVKLKQRVREWASQ